MKNFWLGLAATMCATTLATAAQATVFTVDITFWSGTQSPPANPTSDNVAHFTIDDTAFSPLSDGIRFDTTGSYFDISADGATVDFYDAGASGGMTIIPYLDDGDGFDPDFADEIGTMGASFFTGGHDHPVIQTGSYDQFWYGGDVGDGTFRITIAAADASPAPEPASWALMVGGFGAIGSAMRRRQQTAVRFG